MTSCCRPSELTGLLGHAADGWPATKLGDADVHLGDLRLTDLGDRDIITAGDRNDIIIGGAGLDVDYCRAVAAAVLLYLPWAVLMPLVGVGSFVLDGVFIGATWTRATLRVFDVSALGGPPSGDQR